MRLSNVGIQDPKNSAAAGTEEETQCVRMMTGGLSQRLQ